MADEHPNATVFRRGYEAFNSGDMDTIRELFDENIVWHAGGRNRFSRDAHGIDETLGFFLELMQATDGTFHVDVHDIIAERRPCGGAGIPAPVVNGVTSDDIGRARRPHEERQGDRILVLQLEPVPAGRALSPLTRA